MYPDHAINTVTALDDADELDKEITDIVSQANSGHTFSSQSEISIKIFQKVPSDPVLLMTTFASDQDQSDKQPSHSVLQQESYLASTISTNQEAESL